MPHRTQFLMIGGFLGAGKTTAIALLAKKLQAAGKRVGVVTNDQAFNLVDTHALRAQGLEVDEVPGACFCCKFDELLETITNLGDRAKPDVILTEPVGSCTDLVATVIEPLRNMYGEEYEVGKLAVLCKPEHGMKILAGERRVGGGGFSPQAEYIFLKQLEEADIVVVNKVDKLRRTDADRLAELVHERFPNKQVLLASGKRGDGVDELLEALVEPRSATTSYIEVDYDQYAAGEAELAWLNAYVEATAASDFALDDLVQGCVRRIADNLSQANYEPAHLKVLGYVDGGTSIANLVATGSPAELSVSSRQHTNQATLIVNARVAGEPQVLAAIVDEALDEIGTATAVTLRVTAHQHFSPARPAPTHRFTDG